MSVDNSSTSKVGAGVAPAPVVSTSYQLAVKPGFFTELGVSGMSVATATCATNPIDVVKTRLQLQSRTTNVPGSKPAGMVGTATNLIRNEGVLALWKGLPPAIARGLFYGGLRLGLYSPVKQSLQEEGKPLSLGGKVLAGTTSGAIAAALSSPIELVKTRLQAKGAQQSTSWGVIRDVVQREGIPGLWRGTVPGVVRASLLTASQCATYDEVKRRVMAATGWGDHVGTQLTCSMFSGLVTTTATNPADVVKVVMFTSGAKFSGPLQAASHLMQTEGPGAFMKGWVANYMRLGPQTVITFLVAERLRSLVGLPSL